MQLEQSFTLDRAPNDLWSTFKDLDLLVSCLPGASATGPIDYSDNIATIPLRFEVRLGPIAAVFVGTGKLTPDDETLTGAFEGSAVDRKTNSRVSGTAKFSLREDGSSSPGTKVQVDIDYSLAGSLAQFNRAGIVRQLADALTGEFADRLKKAIAADSDTQRLESGDADLKTGGPASVPTNDTFDASKPAALNPLTLIWSAIRQQCSQLIAKLSGK